MCVDQNISKLVQIYCDRLQRIIIFVHLMNHHFPAQPTSTQYWLQNVTSISSKGLQGSLPREQILKRSSIARQSIGNKKQEILPEILSPFLKKTVNNLFPNISCHIHHLKINLLPNLQRCSHHKEQQKSSARGSKIFNQIEFANETTTVPRIESKICKSFSQTKKHAVKEQLTPQRWLAIRDSLNKMSKIPTENSQSTKDKEPSLIAIRERDYKRCSYVIKQKIAQQLFSEEKTEVRQIKNYLSERQGKSIGKSINIKNYAKFSPIIEILN